MFLPHPVPNQEIPDPNTTGYGFNPARSLPFPKPKNMPQGCWFSGAVRLPWAAPPLPLGPGEAPYFRGVLWASPIFDLRPNLRGLKPQGTTQISPGSSGNAIPIWGWSNHMLYIQVSNIINGAAEGIAPVIPPGFFVPGQTLKVLASEWGHVSDSGQLRQVLPSSDITSQFNTGTDSAVITVRPVGEGLPIRYWRVNLQFIVTDQSTAGAQPTTLNVHAGYY